MLFCTGLLIFQDGRLYEGGFYADKKQGKCIEIYESGNLYEGEYLEGKKHGKGIFKSYGSWLLSFKNQTSSIVFLVPRHCKLTFRLSVFVVYSSGSLTDMISSAI